MKHCLMDLRWMVALFACMTSAVWAQQAQSTPSAQSPQPAATPPPAAAITVAGLAPFERPEGAPVVTEFRPSPEWRTKALQGVSAPIPPTLKFLDDQGAWYSPFIQPGMPGRYDIRGWHAKAVP
jgi:hypothetical protein